LKVVILCGGFGTRLSEETIVKPKPMVEIGDKPILWHIMNIYSAYGFNEFVLALGYKGEVIKEYFLNYYYHQSDLTIDLKSGKVRATNSVNKDWLVNLVDTGQNTMTGGRFYRLRDKLKDGTFMLTYGDGVGNVDLRKLLEFHRRYGKIATFTAVRPPARFGGISFDGDRVAAFQEKPQTGEGWINGGFFVFEPPLGVQLVGRRAWKVAPIFGLLRDATINFVLGRFHVRRRQRVWWLGSARVPVKYDTSLV